MIKNEQIWSRSSNFGPMQIFFFLQNIWSSFVFSIIAWQPNGVKYLVSLNGCTMKTFKRWSISEKMGKKKDDNDTRNDE